TQQLGPFLGFFGGTGPGIAVFAGQFGLNKFTQEFRLASPSGARVEWLLGTFYTHENSYNNQQGLAFNFDGTPMAGPTLPAGFFDAQLPELYDEYAGFGQATWHATEAFSVSAGARYAKNDQNWNEYNPPGPLLNESGLQHVGTHESAFTWMGGLEYRFTKDI